MVLCTIGKFPRNTMICDIHMVFKILYMYNYTIQLCRQQTQVIQNYENAHVHNIGQGEA
jgi:hypothetical protein